MAANAQITVEPYSGSEKESFRQFEQLFRGFIGVAGVAAAQQANFLQLHLRDAALRYFQTLPAPTRADVDLSLTALRDHFCNQDLQEVHVLKLEQLRFDSKKDTPENFLVNLQTKAQRAYPTPVLPAVRALALPGDAGPLDAAEQTRFDGETAARAARLQAAEANKNEQVKRIFIKAMPGWLRSKLMEQIPATPVEDLCTLARRQMTIRDMCRKEDYPEDGFNEISDTVQDNLINALSKINQNQDALEKKIEQLDNKITVTEAAKEPQTSSYGYQRAQAPTTLDHHQIAQDQAKFASAFHNPANFNEYRKVRSYSENTRGRFYANRGNPNMRPRFTNPNPQPFYPRGGYQPRMPRGPYMPVTRASGTFCYTCGYPNHKSSQCSQQRGRPNNRGAQFPFPRFPKN